MSQRCYNVNNDVVTTLSQRCCASWERCKLVIIGKIIYSILYYFIGVVCAITRFVLGRHICAELPKEPQSLQENYAKQYQMTEETITEKW